jgi:hypothetical protein
MPGTTLQFNASVQNQAAKQHFLVTATITGEMGIAGGVASALYDLAKTVNLEGDTILALRYTFVSPRTQAAFFFA